LKAICCEGREVVFRAGLAQAVGQSEQSNIEAAHCTSAARGEAAYALGIVAARKIKSSVRRCVAYYGHYNLLYCDQSVMMRL